MFLSITNQTRGTVVAGRVALATTLGARMVGLLRTSRLGSDEGLWLSPCTSVHTFFMRYTIDVIFLDAEYRVIHYQTLPPWRFSRWVPRAVGVLELIAGSAAKAQLHAGDRLIFEERNA